MRAKSRGSNVNVVRGVWGTGSRALRKTEGMLWRV